MNDLEIRNEILKILSDAYNRLYKKGIVKTKDICSKIDREYLEVKRNIDYLRGKKLIQNARDGIMITELGLDVADPEAAIGSRPENKNQSIQITNSNVGAVTQAHDITINPSDFLERFERLIETAPQVDPKEKAGLCKAISRISKHPALLEGLKALLRSLAP